MGQTARYDPQPVPLRNHGPCGEGAGHGSIVSQAKTTDEILIEPDPATIWVCGLRRMLPNALRRDIRPTVALECVSLARSMVEGFRCGRNVCDLRMLAAS